MDRNPDYDRKEEPSCVIVFLEPEVLAVCKANCARHGTFFRWINEAVLSNVCHT